MDTIEYLDQYLYEAARAFQERVREVQECVHEIAEIITEAFQPLMDFLNSLEQEEQKAEVKRKWPRPVNQKIRPLMMDRRRCVYHCRNNC